MISSDTFLGLWRVWPDFRRPSFSVSGLVCLQWWNCLTVRLSCQTMIWNHLIKFSVCWGRTERDVCFLSVLMNNGTSYQQRSFRPLSTELLSYCYATAESQVIHLKCPWRICIYLLLCLTMGLTHPPNKPIGPLNDRTLYVHKLIEPLK